jgi:hypothetical protein
MKVCVQNWHMMSHVRLFSFSHIKWRKITTVRHLTLHKHQQADPKMTPQNNIHALLPFLTNSDAVCILHHFSRIELFGNVTGAHGDSSEIAEYLLLSC